MKRFIIFVTLFCVSCGVNPHDFGFEGIASIEDSHEGVVVAELILHNGSKSGLTIDSGDIAVKMKREDLLTFILDSAMIIPPQGRVSVKSKWRIRRDDPGTLYAMRNRPLSRYLDRITIDYRLNITYGGKRRRFTRKGLHPSKLNIDFENLL